MEANTFTLFGILGPNPSTKRANRVKWDMKPSADEKERIIAYGTQKNLVMRDMNDCKKTQIYNKQILNNITCVKYSPNGYYIAYGDELGGVRIIGWSQAEKGWVIKYENENMLGGPVNDIAWTDDI